MKTGENRGEAERTILKALTAPLCRGRPGIHSILDAKSIICNTKSIRFNAKIHHSLPRSQIAPAASPARGALFCYKINIVSI